MTSQLNGACAVWFCHTFAMEPLELTKEQLVTKLARLSERNAWLEAQLQDIGEVLENMEGDTSNLSALPEQLRHHRDQMAARAEEERESARAAMALKVEELARAHGELRQLDRLKQDFLSLISHELRTPLSVIVGYAGILEDEVGRTSLADQHAFLRNIMTESDKLLILVNNILDMNRLIAGELTLDDREVSFAEITENVVRQMASVAEHKGIRLAVEVPDHLPLLRSDEQRLGQVLSNLVANALKFTPSGGTVTVRACSQPASLRCEVQDNGIGIEAEDVPRLFQVFGQLDPSATRLRGGLGLGLALVRALVTLMGGKVGVLSAVGKGSTFWFEIPWQPPATAPASAVAIRKYVY